MEFRTALHWAAVLGSSEMVSLLMKRGAPTLATDAVGATPLHYAVSLHGGTFLMNSVRWFFMECCSLIAIVFSSYRHRTTMW